MDSERWDLLKSIVGRVCDLAGDERDRRLHELCGEDRELLREARTLLQDGAVEHATEAFAGAVESHPESDPESIGPYRVLEVLGQGGMGVVYLAEQQEPVRRKVALKVIKLGMDTRQVVARFLAERQALAMMDHPNIARVFDGGMTEAGQPYFAMERVRGVAINEFCDSQKLSIEARLRLFVTVCHAVQHAHQKGVIHRDLKPSNILVSLESDVPVPKVIDFGVAKATGSGLTRETLFTSAGQLLGTPEYMSPEQALPSGLDVDTRTDIYALGVILYELLVGELPLDAQLLRKKSLGEMQRAIREDEPSRPSTRLTTLAGDAAAVAQRRRSDPTSLARTLRGDLDWIVMKALDKERARRFDTANALALDIERYLADEPIAARPPSVSYRAQKFLRRYRFAAGLAITLTLALLAGVVGTSFGLVQARRESARAHGVLDKLRDLLVEIDSEKVQGDVRRRTVLEAVADVVTTDLDDRPADQVEMRYIVGKLYTDLGLAEQAEEQLAAGLAVARVQFGESDKRTRDLRNQLGRNYANGERFEDALRIFSELHAELEADLGSEAPRTLSALQNIAAMELALGHFAEAEAHFAAVLEARRRTLGPDDAATLATMANLAELYRQDGRLELARQRAEDVLEARRRVLGSANARTLNSAFNLARIHHDQGRHDKAVPLFREAYEGFRVAYDDEHPDVVLAGHELATGLLELGRPTEAEPIAAQNLARARVVDPEGKPARAAAELLARIRQSSKS